MLRKSGSGVVVCVPLFFFDRASGDDETDHESFELSELNAALRIIQSFDPVGVAARDVRECLLLQ